MDTHDTIKYILDTYPEYIDSLSIIDLKNLLLKDSNIKEDTNIWYTLRTIMQLIVDECGVDIVNDIDLQEYKKETLYQMFGTVFQDFAVLAFPVKENVAASKEVDEARVKEVLEKQALLNGLFQDSQMSSLLKT